jgi:hypothetical protein
VRIVVSGGEGLAVFGAVARGGWSSDPEKRRKQEATLAAGRAIARERRAAGLPTKRREGQSTAGDGRQTGDAGGGRVKPGTYGKTGGRSGGGTTPATRQSGRSSGKRSRGKAKETTPKLGRVSRVYARVLGFDV